MSKNGSYREYARQMIESYPGADPAKLYLLVDSVNHLEVRTVLDVGCGAGQEMIPFAERRDAFCVGIDIGEELGEIGNAFVRKLNRSDKINFVRSEGADLPFAANSFDVVLCRVSLPYMDNKKAIAEVSRVLRPGGVFLLKTHAPSFYFGMLKRRSRTFELRQYAYPIICLAGSLWNQFTGRQPQKGFWRGKEIYQTKGFLKKELEKNHLRIEGNLPDTNFQTPSFFITKH